MQDKIKELEQEIARMQKTIQELKKQVPKGVISKSSSGLFIGSFNRTGKQENRLIFKDLNMDKCLVSYLNRLGNVVEFSDVDFVNAEYRPTALTYSQIQALDGLVGKFLQGIIV